MSYENTYNQDLANKLIKAENPEKALDQELNLIRARALEMNSACKKMAQGYKQVLEGLAEAFPNLDLKDPNFTDSPNRMARALIEISSGLGTSASDVFRTTFPAEDYDEVIILKDIDFVSMCSHHFYPFTGKAHIGYLPDVSKGKESKVVGLSKLARIVDAHAQRPQLQERLCANIMSSMKEELSPYGIMVVIEATHGCLSCRGAKKKSAVMITSAVDGAFKTNAKIRKEFLSLINK